MPISIKCPSCSVKLALADDRAGTTMDCPKCDTSITVPKRNREPEPVEDDEPDEKPISKQGTKRRKKNTLVVAIIGGGIALVMLLACAGVGGWYFFLRDNPKIAYEEFADSMRDRKYDKAWDRVDSKTQSEFNLIVTNAKAAPLISQDILRFLGGSADGKTGKDLFVAMVADIRQDDAEGKNSYNLPPKPAKFVSVASSTVTDDRGSVTINRADGTTETLGCIRESGKWRIRFSEKANSDGKNPASQKSKSR